MGVATYILLLSLCLSVLCNPDRNVDCRKFVFAPLCRGVAAKRASPVKAAMRNGIILDSSKLKALLNDLNLASEIFGEEITVGSEAVLNNKNSRRQETEGLPFNEYDRNK